MIKKVAIIIVGLAFLLSFILQEKIWSDYHPSLANYPPAVIQKIALGYMSKLAAESEYVSLSVFLGKLSETVGIKRIDEIAENYSYNLEVVAKLHPEFLDTYFLIQATLPYISKEYAMRASEMLLDGFKVLNTNFLLPFFAGFNYFFHAGENEKAAKIFMEIAGKNGAPSWLGHLGAVLRGKDGNLEVGLVSLNLLYKISTNTMEKERLIQDIKSFQNALVVDKAKRQYISDSKKQLTKLTDLVPTYLKEIPDCGPNFQLILQGDVLKLIPPEKKESNDTKKFSPFL